MNERYNLEFLTDNEIFEHVKVTLNKYRYSINLKEFNKNLIDPVKLTFDSRAYGKTVQEIVETECIRQIDKSNTNHIGYFHQNIFRYFDGWDVPDRGFDAVNEEDKIYAEIKNKHNTMNSSSSQKTYSRMQNKILRDDQATCYLVEVIAKRTGDSDWVVSMDGERMQNRRIRRISIDRFYEIATGCQSAFRDLCSVLPQVIDDVINEQNMGAITNSVFEELEEISPNLLKSLYLLPFQDYIGFDNFDC